MKVHQLYAIGPLQGTDGPGRIVSKTVYVSAQRAADESPAFAERCLTALSENDASVLSKIDQLGLLELEVDVAGAL